MSTSGQSHRVGLHIDVLSGGHCIGEEIFFDRRSITVGWSQENAVVLPDDHAPKSLPLFHRSGDHYQLHYDDHTHGVVTRAPGANCLDLSEMHFMSSVHRGGYDLDLREGARGQLQVGDETLLFEAVAEPEALGVPHHRWRWWFIAVAASLALLASRPWLRASPRSKVALPEPIDDYIWVAAAQDSTDEPRMRPSEVARALAELQLSVAPTYVKASRWRPRLRGEVVVRVALDGEGRVTDVTVIRDDLRSSEVRSRLLEVLRRWRAPSPIARAAQFEIPYRFLPSS